MGASMLSEAVDALRAAHGKGYDDLIELKALELHFANPCMLIRIPLTHANG